MRLIIMPADRYAAYFVCINCGKRMVLSKAEPPIYADLDGEPYRAYYCADCAAPILAKHGATDHQ